MTTTINNITITHSANMPNTILSITKTNVVSLKDLNRAIDTLKRLYPIQFERIMYLNNINEYLFYVDSDNIRKNLEKGGYRFID